MSVAVRHLDQVVPPDLANDLRSAFANGYLRPINAYAELYRAGIPLTGIDHLGVSEWLRSVHVPHT